MRFNYQKSLKSNGLLKFINTSIQNVTIRNRRNYFKI